MAWQILFLLLLPQFVAFSLGNASRTRPPLPSRKSWHTHLESSVPYGWTSLRPGSWPVWLDGQLQPGRGAQHISCPLLPVFLVLLPGSWPGSGPRGLAGRWGCARGPVPSSRAGELAVLPCWALLLWKLLNRWCLTLSWQYTLFLREMRSFSFCH